MYNVPANEATVVNGSCGNLTDMIILQWHEQNHLTLEFVKNVTLGRFELTTLRVHINASEFPGAKGKFMVFVYYSVIVTYRWFVQQPMKF